MQVTTSDAPWQMAEHADGRLHTVHRTGSPDALKHLYTFCTTTAEAVPNIQLILFPAWYISKTCPHCLPLQDTERARGGRGEREGERREGGRGERWGARGRVKEIVLLKSR